MAFATRGLREETKFTEQLLSVQSPRADMLKFSLMAVVLLAACASASSTPTEAESIRAQQEAARAAYEALPPARVPSPEELDAESAREMEARRKNVQQEKRDRAAKTAKKRAARDALGGAEPVEAEALLSQFLNDQPTAHAHYSNHFIAVAGVIGTIVRSQEGFIFTVEETQGSDPNTVDCPISFAQMAAAQLSPGQLVAVRGTVSSLSVYSPILLHCRLIPVSIWDDLFIEN